MISDNEKSCSGWFMRKKGKHWLFGCTLLAAVVTVALARPAAADDVAQNNGQPSVTETVTETAYTEGQTAVVTEDAAGLETETAVADLSVSEAENGQIGQVEESAPAVSEDRFEETPTAETKSDDVPTVAAVTQDVRESDNEIQTETAPTAVSSEVQTEANAFATNLKEISSNDSGIWQIREDGLYSNHLNKGDSFLYSQTNDNNFVYATDVTFLQQTGAAALVFRSNNDPNAKSSYAVNFDAGSKKAKLWRWDANQDIQLIDEKDVQARADNTYHLKVVAIDSWISYYINETLIASTGDYTMQRQDKGQDTVISDGYFGLLNWNGEMVFQNTYFSALDDRTAPLIDHIQVISDKGTVEKQGQFFALESTHIQYVSNEAEAIDLAVSARNPEATIVVEDSSGQVYDSLSQIPLKVGSNYLTVKSSIKDSFGRDVTLTYRLNVHRRQAAQVYYNELYRGQYHYSVKDGWANDPNGLVYYNGTYHLFYQFYDDIKWGPMHWAHATSKDLISWQEEPIAFYPDANGTMFSGCIVADTTNSSGLFKTDQGGLVAIITANGNGQRMKIAYSEDEGKTWQKSDRIAADWSDDPLQSPDFRDPKVFRWEDKWFMVVAGGPLRIYSSDNLLDWTCESTYADLHTECPDLYPLQAQDGSLKWVLSRGGRYYKIGDFKQVEGKWTFVADSDYEHQDRIMNFGKDSYAAMTYYVQDFGSKANPTLPDVVALNWMNTWDDYCNLVAETVGQRFNGTFNLNLKLGLTLQDGHYLLTQSPIEAYKTLRDTENVISYQDVELDADNDLLKDFEGETYEIVARFRPDADTTKVGFNLRVGEGQVTQLVYDVARETLSLDRSQSGTILSQKFAQIDSQHVTRNVDGSIDLHLYVDRASIEVFAKGDTVAGANQIFPSPQSLGLSVLVEGGKTKADISLYRLKSIWKDKLTVTSPLAILPASPTDNHLYVGDKVDLKAYIMPAELNQAFDWEVEEGDLISAVQKDNALQITALKKGSLTVTARSKENPDLSQTFNITILENNFKTNLKDLKALAGNWYIDGEALYVSNRSANDYYMSTSQLAWADYELDVDLKYQTGLVNIFFASQNPDPAHAYAIQFGDSDRIRLYRFFGDTIAEGKMDKPINDNQFHHIKLVKTQTGLTVLVDGVAYLSHTFAQVDDYYNAPYVGLGLWDGALEVQNFFVTPLNAVPEEPGVITEPKELRDPETGVSVTLQAGELASIEGIKVSHMETADKLTPSVLSSSDYDLFDIVLVDKDGLPVQISQQAKVYMPIDAGKQVAKVVYLPNSDQEEILPFEVLSVEEEGETRSYVVFDAQHFSQYALVYEESTSASEEIRVGAGEGLADGVNQINQRSKEQTFHNQSESLLLEQPYQKVLFSEKSELQRTEASSAKILPDTGDKEGWLFSIGWLSVLGSVVMGVALRFKNDRD